MSPSDGPTVTARWNQFRAFLTFRSIQNSFATAANTCGSSVHRLRASYDRALRTGRGSDAIACAHSKPAVGHSCNAFACNWPAAFDADEVALEFVAAAARCSTRIAASHRRGFFGIYKNTQQQASICAGKLSTRYGVRVACQKAKRKAQWED